MPQFTAHGSRYLYRAEYNIAQNFKKCKYYFSFFKWQFEKHLNYSFFIFHSSFHTPFPAQFPVAAAVR